MAFVNNTPYKNPTDGRTYTPLNYPYEKAEYAQQDKLALTGSLQYATTPSMSFSMRTSGDDIPTSSPFVPAVPT